MDPATLAIISILASAAKGAGKAYNAKQREKAAKLRTKQYERETYGNLFNDAAQGNAELEGMGLESRSHMGKRRAKSLQDTSDLVRSAFNL